MVSGVSGCGLADLRPVRVVVVDADDRVRAALRTTIDSEPDLEVSGMAADADAALPLVVAHRFCVALVDVPGPGTLAGMTALSAVMGCRVVAMSASRSAHMVCIGAGATEFVLKGGDADAILSALRRAGGASPRPSGDA